MKVESKPSKKSRWKWADALMERVYDLLSTLKILLSAANKMVIIAMGWDWHMQKYIQSALINIVGMNAEKRVEFYLKLWNKFLWIHEHLRSANYVLFSWLSLVWCSFPFHIGP